MKATIKLTGGEATKAKLKGMLDKAKFDGNPVIAVGYSAAYALAVHENVGMALKGQPRPSGLGNYWDAGSGPGRSKYLEAPARYLRQELSDTVTKRLQAGNTLTQALLVAGLRLQRESQELVPVEYGVLRASASTEVEQ